MLRFLTAGESHGKALTVIVEGMPSNIPIKKSEIQSELKRRMIGFGRGERMKIETDSVEILSGIRYGKTLGSPITLQIKNKDFENWVSILSEDETSLKAEKISIPRPGHADLTGTLKYNFDDIRNSIERSSARETAVRVAAGAVFKALLKQFNIEIGSCVNSLAGIIDNKNTAESLITGFASANNLNLAADASEVRVLDLEVNRKIVDRIIELKEKGDTAGGTFFVLCTGLPIGLGSFMQWDRKLEANLAHAILSINAVKGIEFGLGFEIANRLGSEFHSNLGFDDEKFYYDKGTDGIDGGISNGMPLIFRAIMKPISTMRKPKDSIDFSTLEKVSGRYERSDVNAVPACAVIAESMTSFVLCNAFLDKFGGDSLEEIKFNYHSYNSNFVKNIKQKFGK